MSEAKGLNQDTKVGELEVLLEVTEWSTDVLNHTYLVDKGKGWLVAYRNAATGEIQVFSKPMKQFSKSRRKFKKVVDKELLLSYNV